MSSDLFSHGEKTAQDKAHLNTPSNVPELTVSELAHSVKRALETSFSRIRVRGELSGVKLAGSGHLYSDLKDADAVINIVCWRSTLARLSIKPEDGLDVIVTGKVSSYPKSSRFQIVVESIELAGEGALLKLLEERRKKLAAEGLFDPERKKSLPFIPNVIGVVSSPSGAVIRDIMHRLNDRFPRHVLLWPVNVQGQGAAQQIASAINGFNTLQPNNAVPKPDLLIVARGGGSLEDLMAFNEEIVVRAVADSLIPVISAVGHETDTTLIDYVADRRAPTPSAAAEMAVPVRRDLLVWTEAQANRMGQALNRSIRELKNIVFSQTSRLGSPQQLFENRQQTLDFLDQRFSGILRNYLQQKQHAIGLLSGHIQKPDVFMQRFQNNLRLTNHKLQNMRMNIFVPYKQKLSAVGRLPRPSEKIKTDRNQFSVVIDRLNRSKKAVLETQDQKLKLATRLLHSLSYQSVLDRGFVVVKNKDNKIISDAGLLGKDEAICLHFKDQKIVHAKTQQN